jgi:small ligand-binding sensory domain FIST
MLPDPHICKGRIGMGIDENINIGRELQEHITELEAEVERLRATLEKIEMALDGEDVSDFIESCLIVRRVADLMKGTALILAMRMGGE